MYKMYDVQYTRDSVDELRRQCRIFVSIFYVFTFTLPQGYFEINTCCCKIVKSVVFYTERFVKRLCIVTFLVRITHLTCFCLELKPGTQHQTSFDSI